MKVPTFIAAAGALLLASGAPAADHAHAVSRPHAAAQHHPARTVRAVRHARVYDASNVATRSYGHKSSSFVPRRVSKSVTRHGAVTHSTVAQHTAAAAAPTRSRRSPEVRARDDFRQDHPCPSTGWTTGNCPGYVIEPVKAVKQGGAESLANMQWRATDSSK